MLRNGDCEKLGRRVGTAEMRSKTASFDVFHDEKDFVLVFDDIVNAGNVRIVQNGCALCLFPESCAIVWVLFVPWGDSFQGNRPVELRIFSSIHLSHSTGAEAFTN